MDKVLEVAETLGFDIHQGKQKASGPSIRLIEILKQLSELDDEISRVSSAIESNQLFEQHGSLISKEALEKKLSILQQLNSHLRDFLDHWSSAAAYLQEPYSGEYIVVNAKHQEEFRRMIYGLSNHVSNFGTDIESLTYGTQIKQKQDQLQNVFSSLAGCLALYSRYHQALVSMQSTVKQLVLH